jgi:hypothetical protein
MGFFTAKGYSAFLCALCFFAVKIVLGFIPEISLMLNLGLRFANGPPLTILLQPFDRGRVDTEPQTRWWWAIGKNMAQMTIAYAALCFNACHAKASIFYVPDYVRLHRIGKTWPARARLKFCSRIEKHCAAASAGIQARLVCFAILAREGALGSLLSGYIKFFFGKEALPLLVGFFNSMWRGGAAILGVLQYFVPIHFLPGLIKFISGTI